MSKRDAGIDRFKQAHEAPFPLAACAFEVAEAAEAYVTASEEWLKSWGDNEKRIAAEKIRREASGCLVDAISKWRKLRGK